MTAHANLTEKSDVPFSKELIGSRAVIQVASGAGKTYAIRPFLRPRTAARTLSFHFKPMITPSAPSAS